MKKKDCFLVKVGESRQLNNRRRNYKSHNPFAIMRSSCAGTESQEKDCHLKLYLIGKKVSGTEWFIVNEECFNELYQKGMGYFFTDRNIYFDEIFINKG